MSNFERSIVDKTPSILQAAAMANTRMAHDCRFEAKQLVAKGYLSEARSLYMKANWRMDRAATLLSLINH